jgi:hypothetical protein
MKTVSLWCTAESLRSSSALFSLGMIDAHDNSVARLLADRDRLDKFARLIIQRKGLTLQFEHETYLIDWLDVNRIQHGVSAPDLRSAIDQLNEAELLSFCEGSDLIQQTPRTEPLCARKRRGLLRSQGGNSC